MPTFIDAKHAIAHNKIMIIDGQTIITGSFNFTKAAEQNNAGKHADHLWLSGTGHRIPEELRRAPRPPMPKSTPVRRQRSHQRATTRRTNAGLTSSRDSPSRPDLAHRALTLAAIPAREFSNFARLSAVNTAILLTPYALCGQIQLGYASAGIVQTRVQFERGISSHVSRRRERCLGTTNENGRSCT